MLYSQDDQLLYATDCERERNIDELSSLRVSTCEMIRVFVSSQSFMGPFYPQSAAEEVLVHCEHLPFAADSELPHTVFLSFTVAIADGPA